MRINLNQYDNLLIQFSGGKDSVSCFLHLLDLGVPPHKIELWHQEIDGKGPVFMDWEITPDYCRQFAKAFDVRIYFQWKIGGFKRELFREHTLTAPTRFELPDGSEIEVGGKRGKLSTRRKFPQVAADLKTRWCSAYLKVDVCKAAIINQERFRGKRVLVISGERAEESPNRARYKEFGQDPADLRDSLKYARHVNRWRPVHGWKEKRVWEIIERYRVRVHPCYYMGWSRCSCKFCIFSGADQFASAARVSPELFQEIVRCEDEFGCTIKRNIDLLSLVEKGSPYPSITPKLIKLATGSNYNESIIIPATEPWTLPAGAYGLGAGPN